MVVSSTTFPIPSDVGNYFGVPVRPTAEVHVPQSQYSAPSVEIYDRSRSFSAESYVGSIFDIAETSKQTYITSPLEVPDDNVVESNYDPNLHLDKFWLENGTLQSDNRFIAEPLISEEVVQSSQELYTAYEVITFLVVMLNF